MSERGEKQQQVSKQTAPCKQAVRSQRPGQDGEGGVQSPDREGAAPTQTGPHAARAGPDSHAVNCGRDCSEREVIAAVRSSQGNTHLRQGTV